jgi:predicted RNA-binding Zn-ribbon protein involved in translation (DUF1610 family)
MPMFAARRVDREVERPKKTSISHELPLFVGGRLNVERGDATVTCPNCGVVLLDSVQIERFARIVLVCPKCYSHCDPSPA